MHKEAVVAHDRQRLNVKRRHVLVERVPSQWCFLAASPRPGKGRAERSTGDAPLPDQGLAGLREHVPIAHYRPHLLPCSAQRRVLQSQVAVCDG